MKWLSRMFLQPASRPGPHLWAAGLLAVVLMHSPAARAQTADELLRAATDFPSRVARLEERYLSPAILESRYRLESRFNDAKVAYLLQDFPRASILFVDILEHPRFQQFDSHREALYLLADSLFRLRNFRASREYLRAVVQKGPGPFQQEAIYRLLEIASMLKDYQEVDELFARLDPAATISPAVAYMRAKTLYEQGRHAESRRWFQSARAEIRFDLAAHYYEAVALVAEGELLGAQELFASLALRKPMRPEDGPIIDLAILALGRIAYEQGDLDRAIDHYSQLPRTSPSFDRALYEMTWALVSKGNFAAALRNVEVLLYFRSNPRFEPEAKLLRADLALRVKDYGDAAVAYQDVIETFGPVRQELHDFIANQPDLQRFFVDLVRQDLAGVEADFLPPLVNLFAENNPLLQSAAQMLGDVQVTREDIDDGHAALDEIEARLESVSPVRSFPGLAEALAFAIEHENQLLDLHRKILDYEHKLLEASLTPEERQRWSQAQERLQAFLERYKDVPRTHDDFQRREFAMKSDFNRLRTEVSRVAYELQSQSVQLQAIEVYLKSNPMSEMGPEERQNFERLRATSRETVSLLEQMHKRLSREVNIARSRVGVGDDVMRQEAGLRLEYRAVVEQLGQSLQTARQRAPEAARAELASLAQATQSLPGTQGRIQSFQQRVQELVQERVGDLRSALDQERRVLAAYQQDLGLLSQDSEAAAAAVAYDNFQRVSNEFTRIIMRGEIGLIDVGWRSKEDVTTGIKQLFEERASELQMLRESFKEVR